MVAYASTLRGSLVSTAQRIRLAVPGAWTSSAFGRGRYHPERHYMRGPGPKWHAKHGGSASSHRTKMSIRRAIGEARLLL
jgi:hypothetical protein